jgi:prepilin-type N-terminal cleavage/methylation domain-containing protein
MNCPRSHSGLTLIEVLVTITLISIVLVPAIRALQTGILGSTVHNNVVSEHYRLQSRMEEVLAEPFSSLGTAAQDAGGPSVPSSYSDAAGPPERLLVYLSFYDGDNADADGNPFTGTEPDLLWIRVEAEGTAYALQMISASGFQ